MPSETGTLIINLTKPKKTLNFDLIIKQIWNVQNDLSLSHWSEKDYSEELKNKNSIFLIAGTEMEIRGFILTRMTSEYTTANFALGFEHADILNFGVAEQFQKQGIGSQLFAAMMEILIENGVKNLWLEVRESNLSGIGFYLKENFEVVSRRKNFYSQPTENALVLRLNPAEFMKKFEG